MSRGTRVVIGIGLAVLAVVGCSRRPEALPEGVTTVALDGRWGKAVRALDKGRDVAFVPPPLAEKSTVTSTLVRPRSLST